MNPTSIRDVLRAGQRAGLDRLDAQMLLLFSLERDPNARAWLMAHDEQPLTAQQHSRYLQLCERRLNGEPLAYLTGHKEFFGLSLGVDARVLVPRPDTETLVQWGLDVLGGVVPAPGDPLQMLDLGTGSGAIALAIKANHPTAVVWATDASTDALAVASANARRLGLSVTFRPGRWWDATPGERFHLILSNPPYIEPGDPHLDRLTHEPRSALVAEPDGLSDLRALVAGAPGHLHAGGWLLLEHGHDQAEPVRTLLEQAGYTNVSSRKDLAGIDRCSGGQWLEKG